MTLKQSDDIMADIKKANEENQRTIKVTASVLKAALREIQMQKQVNGETFFTRGVIASLTENLRAAGITVRDE
ncbi:hypothetical protein [Pectobacterium carotovorum]|uniref:hypothetical protein n=1 Tax=Pectobacterium carotovorum TaxID=554 RepID=UPI0021F257D7|nr:hypothetical protein [Pectobacterium carotovorum]